MSVRYVFLRYVVQLLLIVVAYFSGCALFGIFYALAYFTGRITIIFPIALMFTGLRLFWKKIKQPFPTMLRIFFVCYVICGLIVSFIPDPNGNYLAFYFLCGAIPFLSVAFWSGTDAIVSRLQAQLTNEFNSNPSTPQNVSYQQPSEEKQTLFSDKLQALRTEPLQESSGKMIADMIVLKPSKELLVYTRRWLAQFRDHELAPKLVGHWLEKYDSNEAMYSAEYYLRTVTNPIKLRGLLLAIGMSKRSPRKIYDLIEARLEKDPHQDAWSYLQNHKCRANNKRAEKVVLRWLELNRSNPDQDIIVSAVAMFTTSVDIIESTLQWAKTVGNSRGYYFVLTHLLSQESDAHILLKPRIVEFSRNWIADHIDDKNCGHVYGALVASVKNADDMRAAKEWYMEHKSNETAQWVLIGLLRAHSALKQEADLYVVEETKQWLRNQSPKDRTPVMVAALVNAHLDAETISFAKQKGLESNTWLLGLVLRLAADAEVIAKARQVLAQRHDVQLEHDLLFSRLRMSPADLDLRKDARRWIRKHGQKFSSKELKNLLAGSTSR